MKFKIFVAWQVRVCSNVMLSCDGFAGNLECMTTSDIKEKAFRTRDVDHFAKAPVTLALGAMGALALYPLPAAAVAIYSLAFGDTAACLVGKSMGKTRIPYTGKTLEGSMACFATVFALAFHAAGCSVTKTAAAALAATLTELLPVKDYDNLLIPLVTGLILTVL